MIQSTSSQLKIAYDLVCTKPLDPNAHREVVRTMALAGHKWDIQMGDTAVLSPYAITISDRTWQALAGMAEALAAEVLAAEAKAAERTDLWTKLGMPRRLREILDTNEPWTPSTTRVMRFDFHPTTCGWRISEVNSDVPGGFNEASMFTALMQDRFPGNRMAGDPLKILAASLARAVGSGRSAVLLSAPGYLEDHQVVSGVSEALADLGIPTVRARPEQLSWKDGQAWIEVGDEIAEVGAIYRFFQAEWVTRMKDGAWGCLFRGGRTPVCNSGTSALSESKRFPLIWRDLSLSMPTWLDLLPETRGPWPALFMPAARSVRKTAYCNTGDIVVSRAWSGTGRWAGSVADSLIRPRGWVAQQRFESVPLEGPDGEIHPCLGVYVIDGRAAGIYGRISRGVVIDFKAQDVAVLIRN